MNRKIGIVLLNYKNYLDTINCLESLSKQSYKNFTICVIDNYSNNNSLDYIKQYSFSNYISIHYIQNNENLGFAKGNNVGIHYLKEKEKCELIFVLNTDTIIENKDFLKKANEFCNNIAKDVAVINPMCYDLDKNYMYPSFKCDKSIENSLKGMKRYLYKYFIKALFNINYSNNVVEKDKLLQLDNYKYVIQGCSYFLTSSFFEYYDELYPNTFLYCEELALAVYLDKKELKTINCYEIALLHKEGGSSIRLGKIHTKFKKLFEMIDSYKKVKRLYKNNN